MRKIIIKNRRNNKDEQVLTLDEFKAKFKNELTSAIQIYSHDQQQKGMLRPPFMHSNNDYELDFYRDLRWNFNNNAQTIYYIDKIEY